MVQENAPFDRSRYLFSFVGKAANSSVRSEVLNLKDSDAFLADRWSRQTDADQEYAQVLADSKFVLCPKGYGPSTWRLFEAMRTGRSPVIISDDWRPPVGPSWDEFAVIVSENEVHQIPERLRALEHLAPQMGRRAWEEWARCFSKGTAFSWMIDCIEGIQSTRGRWEAVAHRNRLLDAVRDRQHCRSFVKEWLRELLHGRPHPLR